MLQSAGFADIETVSAADSEVGTFYCVSDIRPPRDVMVRSFG